MKNTLPGVLGFISAYTVSFICYERINYELELALMGGTAFLVTLVTLILFDKQ